MNPRQLPPLPVPSHSPPHSDTFLQRLPDSIDLIVMEWAASASNVDSARWLDDALHRVLHRWQAQQPAILLVHFFFWCRGNIGCRGYKVRQRVCGWWVGSTHWVQQWYAECCVG